MRLIEKVWFHKHAAKWLLVPLLLPLTLIFAVITAFRRLAFKIGLLKSIKVSVPVVVVGNIGIGGNGKTPVALYLVEKLKQQGLKVGVVSRGYGSKAPYYPYQISTESSAEQAGDEPLLLFQRTGVPVVIGADRIKGCELLIAQGCGIIIADDGLQHYRLARDFELVVVDGKRGFGNGLLLPAGPLRETKQRMLQANCIIVNGKTNSPIDFDSLTMPIVNMQLSATHVVNIKSGERITLSSFINEELRADKRVNALAGIGDPSRFFSTLEQLGLTLAQSQGFIDHQAFSASDLQQFGDDIPLLMPAK